MQVTKVTVSTLHIPQVRRKFRFLLLHKYSSILKSLMLLSPLGQVFLLLSQTCSPRREESTGPQTFKKWRKKKS